MPDVWLNAHFIIARTRFLLVLPPRNFLFLFYCIRGLEQGAHVIFLLQKPPNTLVDTEEQLLTSDV